ncbi:MAG TPA: IS21 family transposase [Sphingobacteriaceae bacterium]|nr:IS21 family transposase [Sphingobacteriaceae bacterium]
MDKKTIGDWIMYHEVQRLQREGQSCRAIAKALVLNRRTVVKYLAMSEAEYEGFLGEKESRAKLLGSFESFVKDRLVAHPAASAAQVHDWLKENYKRFPSISAKTVYNFVMAIRQKYSITLEEASREYFVVAELPYGLQAQADFGQYILRNSDEKRKKVHFFVMMLSRSRMKFVRFSATPFTTLTAIEAHEEAFNFFSGMPKEVVYDQDRLFLVDENLGDLLVTQHFNNYIIEQAFNVHFCRKADPQSKGKVENVVKFVKNNFLYGRAYYDIDILQSQVIGWLDRTGNGMPHTTTRNVPSQEWIIEKEHLTPWVSINILPAYIMRYVRLDNTISYQGNFYTVPQGTFKKDATVMTWVKGDELHIHDDQRKFLCKHIIPPNKGNKVINTDHKRDKTRKLKDLVADVAALFSNPLLAGQYFELINQVKPRYLRDQVQAIREAISGCNEQLVNKVLEKCVQERYLSAVTFSELLTMYEEQDKSIAAPAIGKIILMDPNSSKKAETKPDKSDLGDYEKVFKK